VDHPLLSRLHEGLRRFRAGEIDLAHLHGMIASTGPLLEGDVPAEIRSQVESLDGKLESVIYLVSESNQRAAALELLATLEDQLKQLKA
jgi:hypothetical protein